MAEGQRQRRPRLHEILAVEHEKKASADRARSTSIETFRSKQAHFSGIRRTFKPFAVDEALGEVAGERVEAETRLVKTVAEELGRTLDALSGALNMAYQIDETNTRARADIIVDGVTLAGDVPATFLLQLERRLGEVRALLKEAPTFDPVRTWEPDPEAERENVLRAASVATIRKQRTRRYNVMVEATPEHPAQVDIVEVDEPVGEIRAYEWTGMVSPAKKAALLRQLETLLAAIKSARSRANMAEVDTSRDIAGALFTFLMRPLQ